MLFDVEQVVALKELHNVFAFSMVAPKLTAQLQLQISANIKRC